MSDNAFWLGLRKLLRRRIVAVATLLLATVVLGALGAQWLTPFDPNDTAIAQRLRGPGHEHWLGTDELGRDLLARVAFGARFSLAIAALTALGAVLGGTALGLVAGFFRRLDAPLMRLVDALMAQPDILLANDLVAI
ncbi:MAG: peptide ABC transporter permease, partial [Burkholderiales bacterium PBB5]